MHVSRTYRYTAADLVRDPLHCGPNLLNIIHTLTIVDRALRPAAAIFTPHFCTVAACVGGNYLGAARAGKTLYEGRSCRRGRFFKMFVRDGTSSRRVQYTYTCYTTVYWSTVSYRNTRTRSGVSTALSNPEIRVLDLVIATSIYRSTLNSRFRYYSVLVQEMYIAEGPGSSIQRASTKNRVRVPCSTCKAYSRITEHHQLASPARIPTF